MQLDVSKHTDTITIKERVQRGKVLAVLTYFLLSESFNKCMNNYAKTTKNHISDNFS